MAVVKGSTHHSMQLVPYRPWLQVFRYLLVLLGIVVSFFVGAFAGQKYHQYLEAKKAEQQAQVATDLSQELMLLRTNAEVDRQTIESMRQLVMTQKAQITASERDMRVYKELLTSSGKNPLGISFGVFTVSPSTEAGHYTYKLVVQKLSTREVNFSGNLEFKVIGQQAGKAQQLSLDKISSQVTSPFIDLDFKFFQVLEGDMELPLDFTPQTVGLVVRSGDRQSPPIVETQLEWPVSPPPN